MGCKKKVAVIFGGSSAEHDVSLMSASFVLESMDRDRYTPKPLGITREGYWLDEVASMEGLKKGELKAVPGQEIFSYHLLKDIEIAFPVLHGPFGEDGTIQGLFETLQIPYVGSGVLASSLGMDKERMKQSFSYIGLPQTRYLTISGNFLDQDRNQLQERIIGQLGLPCFVKPANMGSSVGITLVREERQLLSALTEARRYDRKILVEQGIPGREVECSLLGGYDPMVSIPGEVIPSRDFYDYKAKYSQGLSRLVVPAPLSKEECDGFWDLSKKAYQAIGAYGLARVDFFLKEDGEILVNEINTIPGFTKYSMYPLLWKASGLEGPQLVHRLLELAWER